MIEPKCKYCGTDRALICFADDVYFQDTYVCIPCDKMTNTKPDYITSAVIKGITDSFEAKQAELESCRPKSNFIVYKGENRFTEV